LFELEIPEVAEHIIEVRSIAREAGYRSKVAVSCFDSKIDCVGACVGVRGSRIKSIVDELAGERIDIVRWNDSLQVLVPNALQPAEADDVILCPMLGKVIVLVRDDQLSLAIGKKGQNVRLASKLVGWDIHVMTQERLDEQLDKSVGAFGAIPGVSEELAENLVAQGFFTYDDLSVIEPDQLAELGGLTDDECNAIVEFAEVESVRQEEEERVAREQQAIRGRVAERSATAIMETETLEEIETGAPAVDEPAVDELEGGETEIGGAEAEDGGLVAAEAEEISAESAEGLGEDAAAGVFLGENSDAGDERVALESTSEDEGLTLPPEPADDSLESAELARRALSEATGDESTVDEEPAGNHSGEHDESLTRAEASAADQ
jgi:N utilization substance protein A